MKVCQENIQDFNELYLKLGTYAAVARKTGFSASTVKKYIINGYVPKAQVELCKNFFKKEEIPESPADILFVKALKNWGDICSNISKEEELRIINLWNELNL